MSLPPEKNDETALSDEEKRCEVNFIVRYAAFSILF